MIDDIKADAHDHMNSAIESYKKDLAGIRTGRASVAMLDDISVEYYGSMMPLNQVATLSTPDARLILIQPWDKAAIEPIEKAINASKIGLNPQNDGKVIRLSIPPLTEERRKDLVKQAGKKSEDARISIRNIRRDAKEMLEAVEKEGDISKDDVHRAVGELQTMTDSFIARIEELTTSKEKEIMEF